MRHLGPSLLAVVVLVAPCGAEGQSCERLPRDCEAEARAFSTRVARLRGLTPAVRAAVEALSLRRRTACLEWNACSLDDAGRDRITAWADRELEALAAASTPEARRTWAQSLSLRATAVQRAPPPSPGVTPTAAPPPITPQVIEALMRMIEDRNAYREFSSYIERTQRGLGRGRAAPICRSNIREQLRTIVRRGAQAIQSTARSLEHQISTFCSHFGARDPQQIRRARHLFRSLELHVRGAEPRVDHRVRCAQGNPRRGRRCRPEELPRSEELRAQDREALTLVHRVQLVLRPLSVDDEPFRFPCDNAVWRQIESRTWTGRTYTASALPGIVVRQRRLCQALGNDSISQANARRQLGEALDRMHISNQQLIRSRETGIRQYRSVWGTRLPVNLRQD